MTEPSPRISIVPGLRFLFSLRATLEPPQLLGRTPFGERRIINITGGTFEGPRLKGKVLRGGADWQIIRPDGVAELEARYTIETHDGAKIYVVNRGKRHGPPEVLARVAAGEPVDPSEYYFRAVPVFETGSETYWWLNNILAVAVGERQKDAVAIDFHEIT